MTKHTHTPGPWRLIKDGPMPDSRSIYAGDYGIGEAWNLNDNPENLANARLIAAAPDMLAALELAKSIVERLWPFEFDYEREAEKAINDAIAKAKGE